MVKCTVNACLVVVIATVLSACIVTTVTEVASFDSIETGKYSHWSAQAEKAEVLDPDCRWLCYRLGENKIAFSPPSRGANVKAAGPIIPVFPAPGKGKDFSDSLLFVGIHVHPGPTSFLILDPEQYLVSVDGAEKPLAPVAVEDCRGNPVQEVELQVYGSYHCYLFFYGITRGEVERFTLMPASIEADEILYMFSDINWEPSSFIWVE